MRSQAFQLTRADVNKWLINTREFLAPLGAIYFGFVIANLNDAGFAWSDFIPNNFVIGSMALYLVNILYDLSRKYSKITDY